MARQILIMARTPQEAGRYAQRAGLSAREYRAVHSAGQIRGLRAADVHILPSFLGSVARHALLAELQWARDVDYFYVDPEDMPTVEEVLASRQVRELGELDDDVLEAAYADQAAFDHDGWAAARHRDQVLSLSPEKLAEVVGALDEHDAALDELAATAQSQKVTKAVTERKAHNAKARNAAKQSAAKPAANTDVWD